MRAFTVRKPPRKVRKCMCLAWKHPISLEACRGLCTVEGQSAPQPMFFTLPSQVEVAPLPVTLPIPTLEDPHAQEGIARGLWPESSPIDSKVKKPSGEQRSRDVGAISSRSSRQFAQLGMPLSLAFQKLMEGGLLTPLAPKPVPQPVPPHFRLDLHCSYHQGSGHDTDHYNALRHAIQDLID
ncbi:hypothetical protein CK203_093281 [Vitis vinifera]|uniref:Uncharacterized protein n=1 Tax=Vitis vinifera TaxID=29760 RepID=A0A438CMH9_VITVI|nr:hypothetical protein CK203_093281 [Vitis vinifera]